MKQVIVSELQLSSNVCLKIFRTADFLDPETTYYNSYPQVKLNHVNRAVGSFLEFTQDEVEVVSVFCSLCYLMAHAASPCFKLL